MIIRRLFVLEKPLVQLHVISWRKWGQPKLKTPLILKGHKPDFKIPWNKKLDFNIGEDGYYILAATI